MVTKVTDDSIEISFATPNWSKVTRTISVNSVVTGRGTLHCQCNRQRYRRDPRFGRYLAVLVMSHAV